MSPPHVEERALHHHTPSDTTSVRSFASSSSTLAPSQIPPTEEKYNVEADSDLQYQPPPHWRKTPLTRPGLFCLRLRILSPLLPSFLRREHPPKPPRKLHPTSYLDGLRGVAAFIVFIDHFAIHWFENIKSGYLASPEDAYLIQLLILRLVYTGRASVGVLFFISGFVLSHKPLLQIRPSQHSSVLPTLSSSVLRHGLRLYVPIIAGTFISAILAYNKTYTDVPTRLETIPPSSQPSACSTNTGCNAPTISSSYSTP